MTREAILTRAMVELADTLVDDFDVVDLLTTLTLGCVEIFEVGAAGIMLVSPEGDLRLMTSSTEQMRLVELFELQAQEGPCLDCHRDGTVVVSSDLRTDARWPRFTPFAVDAGFLGVDAIPMRLRRNVIGALNLFHTTAESLDAADVAAAQALADMATIALLQHAAVVSANTVNLQLTEALNSRILIEQAKGVVAEHQQVDMNEAFSRLRNHARNHNRRLADVAADIVDGTLPPGGLDGPRGR
ncbi:MAG: GAF and ANTAR domain-containing protein [Ilumatobacteraceae bacterium]